MSYRLGLLYYLLLSDMKIKKENRPRNNNLYY